MRSLAAMATATLAFFGLMPWEQLLYVLVVAGSLGGLVSLGISYHALKIARDVQDRQSDRIDALPDLGEE